MSNDNAGPSFKQGNTTVFCRYGRDQLHESQTTPFKYFLVLDFEATCLYKNEDFPHEIIQIGVTVLDVESNTIVEGVSFNKFVRPLLTPIMSDFCAELTGIDQKDLDAADPFETVEQQFRAWLVENQFRPGEFAVLCDSNQDLWRLAQYQYQLSKLTLPAYFRKFINLNKIFEKLSSDEKREPNSANVCDYQSIIERMAKFYKVPLIGRPHNAFDDSQNLARIAQKMMSEGVKITINVQLVCQAYRRNKPMDYYPDWRTDFAKANNVFDRVMHLTTKPIMSYDDIRSPKCHVCKNTPQFCGNIHDQYPTLFYLHEKSIVRFAQAANYDVLEKRY